MAYVQRCNEADFDTSTATCAAPYWSPDTGVLPPLSVSDAMTIGSATLLLWGIAYGLRALRDMVR